MIKNLLLSTLFACSVYNAPFNPPYTYIEDTQNNFVLLNNSTIIVKSKFVGDFSYIGSLEDTLDTYVYTNTNYEVGHYIRFVEGSNNPHQLEYNFNAYIYEVDEVNEIKQLRIYNTSDNLNTTYLLIDFLNEANSRYQRNNICYTLADSLTSTITFGGLQNVNHLQPFYYWSLRFVTPSVTYRFNQGFNYNAFAQSNYTQSVFNVINRQQSPVVKITDNMFAPNETKYPAQIFYELNTGPFVSNGIVYDTITAILVKHTNSELWFENIDNTLVQYDTAWNNGQYYYVANLSYFNMKNNNIERVIACERQTYQTIKDNGNITILPLKMTWTNYVYTELVFMGNSPLNNKQNQYLNEILLMANNDIFTGGFVDNSTTNGLLDIFTLLGVAFNSMAGILGIMIFPNITLGMLICLPLFALILFFIVGLFKR